MKSEVFAKYKRTAVANQTTEAHSENEVAGTGHDEFVEQREEIVHVYSPTQASNRLPETQEPVRCSRSDAHPEAAVGDPLDAADWETINAQADKQRDRNAAQQSTGPSKPISFKEAFLSLRSNESLWSKYVTNELKRVADHVATGGFWGALWSCCHTDITEGSDDYTDRDFVLALQFVPLDHSDIIHQRMLFTIYRRLERPPRTSPDPATRGPHWERLGFQGNDPSTDLRSTGIIGILQVLYLIDYFPTFCGALYQSATNPLTEFPFVLVCFNFSGIAMEALKERGLHDNIAALRRELKKKASSAGSSAAATEATVSNVSGSASSDFEFRPPPVFHSVCEFFAGALYTFFLEWRKSVTRSVTDFGPVKAKLRPLVRKHVDATIKHCDVARDRRHINALTSNKGAIAFGTTSHSAKAMADEKEFMEF